MKCSIACLLLAVAPLCAGILKKKGPPEPTPLDLYIQQSTARGAMPPQTTPGSLYTPSAPLLDFGRDLRARNVDDLVTILVSERASATASGTVKTQRQTAAKASIASAIGPKKATGPLANLADVSSSTDLNGNGTTSRDTTLTTTLTARVTHVLPNGNLVVEGTKEVMVNSEKQTVVVRGVARPVDLTSDNVVRSDRLGQMEVRITGKGVINDATRRPFLLYRILLGLLPF